MRKTQQLVRLVMSCSGIVHFFLLGILFLFLDKYGGTAGLGKFENGSYFVGQHGGYTEVSRNVYFFSEWHLFLLNTNLFVLAVSAGLYWLLKRRSPPRSSGTL